MRHRNSDWPRDARGQVLHSNIGLGSEGGSSRRAASLRVAAATLLHPAALGVLGAGPDAGVGLTAVPR